MAKYRQIHVKIWKDSWFCELLPVHKLFFIYLFSNEMASISGIYELPKRIMSFESGLSFVEIDEAFTFFAESKKAFYQDGIVLVPALRKYHETKSPKVQTLIEKDLLSIKDSDLKNMYCDLYGIDRVYDRVSIPCYSSSSSNSNSFSNGNSDSNSSSTIHTQEYIPNEIQELISSIASICKTPLWPDTERQYSNAAYYLFGLNDFQPEQVAGFSSWWDAHGQYDGKPALKSILSNWQDFRDGVIPKYSNGNGRKKKAGFIPDEYADIIKR